MSGNKKVEKKVGGNEVMPWFNKAKRDICPSCNKKIGRNNMASHLKECLGVIWYSLPVVVVSHIGALSVKKSDNNLYGVWDMVTKDWVRDSNGIIDSRIFRNNADKLLRLIKVKARFNEFVG